MEQIEKDQQNSTVEGELQIPSERVHLFKNHDAMYDFTKIFKIRNYNVREGTLQTTGEYVVELTYKTVNN